MGTLAEMRHLSALTVEVTFEDEVPDFSRVPGVSAVEIVGHLARLQVRGTIEPLLKVLAAGGVTGAFESRAVARGDLPRSVRQWR